MNKEFEMNRRSTPILWVQYFMGLACLLFFFSTPGQAEESLCAVVKIEIKQELTLERQAFDAHMRINNGLTHITLENIGISVVFTDADGKAVSATSNPDDTSAVFYIRLDEKTNISDIDGTGSVGPSTTADIHWLIVPAPGASNGLESGAMYHVGATLNYTLGGKPHEIKVSPDYIYVKPMPEISLDYFLPSEVYGDDAFTDAIEPPVPFSLGIRVKNSGHGVALDLTIESAQPEITENEQGLLIGFSIQGSQVNGNPSSKSLLADFGNIEPGTASTARWIMMCSLSGKFIEFGADFSHSDELGGRVTSLIDSVRTHFLIHDVQVDLPGRDSISDFLAKDGDVYRIYESDNVDTRVADQSQSSSISYVGIQRTHPAYALTTPVNHGFVLVRLTDPYHGTKRIHSAIRSDGKIIKPANIWLSKSRNDKHWDYFLNLFDASTTGTYTVVFADPADTPQPPVLQYISDLTAVEGERISFVVQAGDHDTTTLLLSAALLPAGSKFTDEGNGIGVFDWTPAIGQAGTYPITFSASDGAQEDRRRVTIIIRSITDTDGDEMNDAWEMARFGTLDRDGNGDLDGDGISDLDEYLSGSDPTAEDHAPTVPVILYPDVKGTVFTLLPQLEIENSTDADDDEIAYQFEIYSDEQFTELVAADNLVTQEISTTTWAPPETLTENMPYFWRVRATDGYSFSLWTYGSFFVNATDDPPQIPMLSYPPNGAEVDTLLPTLQVSGATDPDKEVLTCAFEVYEDEGMTVRVTEMSGLVVPEDGVVSWTLGESLPDGGHYFWRALVTDEEAKEVHTNLSDFTVNTSNHTPSPPAIRFPANGDEIADASVMLEVENSMDADGDALSYNFEIDKNPGFTIEHRQVSVLINEGIDTTTWDVFTLEDNTTYTWRANATDGNTWSPWVEGRFFVNKGNDPPEPPGLKNPGDEAWVGVLAPDLSTADGLDPDGDSLTYRFEVYKDPYLENMVAWGETLSTTWTVVMELEDQTRHYWRVRAIDEHGAEGSWMPTASFFIKEEAQPTPESIAVQVITDKGRLLENCRVYAFTSTGSYTGMSATTGSEGIAYFDTDAIVPGVYRFRADYLGSRFWSEDVSLPKASVIPIGIGEETMTVTCDAAAGLISGARVYLFSETGSYLGSYETTDANGQVFFDLPAGEKFLFRADILGSRYWSNTIHVSADNFNSASVHTGGGLLRLAVREDENTFMPGIRVYLFNHRGTYLGIFKTTDETGAVGFDVTEGEYMLRADYLGYRFWSEPVLVTSDTDRAIVVSHQFSILTVQGSYQNTITPYVDSKSYLFSSNGSYLGQSMKMDEEGRAMFNLPEKEFKFRVDVLGNQYWSEPFIWDDPVITIPLADTSVSVTGAGVPKEGVRVYLFTPAGTYLGINGTTDGNGQIAFRLPEQAYDFRADYQGSQFWSRNRSLVADENTEIEISVGGGTFQLKVQDDCNSPLGGVKCYLFSENKAYLGLSASTDENGSADFELADGVYRFRMDYFGQSFWSDPITVAGSSSHEMVIQRATVRVQALAAEKAAPCTRIYLFSASDAYLGRYETTDGLGEVSFELPVDVSFHFRADILGNRYWSGDVNVTDNLSPVIIDAGGGRMEINLETDTGTPLAELPVYLFGENSNYLGLKARSDAGGSASFNLPRGFYHVRIDYLGHSFWKEEIEVAGDTDTSLCINRHPVTITVRESSQNATVLANVRVYLFSCTDRYLGRYEKTGTDVAARFMLPEGRYRFRADFDGRQAWSDILDVSQDVQHLIRLQEN